MKIIKRIFMLPIIGAPLVLLSCSPSSAKEKVIEFDFSYQRYNKDNVYEVDPKIKKISTGEEVKVIINNYNLSNEKFIKVIKKEEVKDLLIDLSKINIKSFGGAND